MDHLYGKVYTLLRRDGTRLSVTVQLSSYKPGVGETTPDPGHLLVYRAQETPVPVQSAGSRGSPGQLLRSLNPPSSPSPAGREGPPRRQHGAPDVTPGLTGGNGSTAPFCPV